MSSIRTCQIFTIILTLGLSDPSACSWPNKSCSLLQSARLASCLRVSPQNEIRDNKDLKPFCNASVTHFAAELLVRGRNTSCLQRKRSSMQKLIGSRCNVQSFCRYPARESQYELRHYPRMMCRKWRRPLTGCHHWNNKIC